MSKLKHKGGCSLRKLLKTRTLIYSRGKIASQGCEIKNKWLTVNRNQKKKTKNPKKPAMHLRYRRVRAQIVSVPLVRPAPVPTSQKLSLAKA